MRLPTRLELQAAIVRRRVRRMTREQMVAWVNSAGTEMSQAFTEHARTGDQDALAEFDRGLAVLVAMSQTLHGRQD
jgi:hypothetical protein